MNMQATTVRPRNNRRAHGHEIPARAHDATEIRTQDPASAESVEAVATAIEKRFGASIPPARRREIAEQAIDHYQNAPIQSYVTILAERLAIDIASGLLPA